MTKPVLYEWALDQTSLPPITRAQWEEGFTYLNSATGGKVPTYVHDYPFSEITKAIRWTLDALPDDGITSAYVENRFKGNQNPVVEGKDGHPLPSATPTTYPAGDEIAAGIIAFTTVVNLTYVNGVYSADSGIMRRLYAKDPAGLITKTSQYGCLKLTDGSQLQALVDDIATNGARITEDGSDVAVDGDFAVTDFRFIGLSDERGALAYVNDDDSRKAVWVTKWTGSVSNGVINVGMSNVYEISIQVEHTGATDFWNASGGYTFNFKQMLSTGFQRVIQLTDSNPSGSGLIELYAKNVTSSSIEIVSSASVGSISVTKIEGKTL